MRQRRTAPRQASGLHVERLEPRTVLSASMGAMPASYDFGPMMVARHEATTDTAWQPPEMIAETGSGHFEDGRIAFNGKGTISTTHDPYRGLFFGGFQRQQQFVLVFVMFDEGGGPPVDTNDTFLPPPQRAQAEAPTGSEPQLGTAGSPDSQANDRPGPPPLRFVSAPAFANFASAVLPTTKAQSADTSIVAARDSVFHAYSTDELLLALGLDDESEEEDSDALDILPEEDEAEQLGLGSELANALLDDDSETAIDSLECERAAVDAVLAELQDVESTPPTNDSKTIVVTPDDNDTNSMPLEAKAAAAQATNDAASAGMVWLVPTGDANSSAWDLSGVFLGELPAIVRGSAEVEATLGIYQAFDVGTPEPTPATADAAPASTPAPGARPNVSAGNQTAKQSDQPS